MYDELYVAWQQEITDSALGKLPPDFYAKIAKYLQKIKEENKPSDKKTVKVSLQEREAQNVKRMLEELLWARYKKIIKILTKNQKVPADLLTVEEAKLAERFLTFSDSYQKFTKNLMNGQTIKIEVPAQNPEPAKQEKTTAHKRVTLRFSKSTPAVIGADLKTYGPFTAEDVAALPVENARIFVKQGLAVMVEVS